MDYIKSILCENGVELVNCRKQCSLSQQYMTKAQVIVCPKLIESNFHLLRSLSGKSKKLERPNL